eukprot:g2232.t1
MTRSQRNQQHEVAVQTLQQRIDQLQKEIIQCDRCANSWEEEKSRRSAKASTAALPGLVIFQRPLPSNHQRRKALLIGVNYLNSQAPLKAGTDGARGTSLGRLRKAGWPAF